MKDLAVLSSLNLPESEFYWHKEAWESQVLIDATSCIKKILDTKYVPADLNKVVQDCKHLNDEGQMKFLKLLKKFEPLFDGMLGVWHDKLYNIKLKVDATPYHARPFPVPKIHEETLKIELEWLCKCGVMKKVNHSEWAAPTFLILKKDSMVQFILDF